MDKNDYYCLFCNISQDQIILENELCFAMQDGFPVTEGHMLVIPKRHIEDYFGLTQNELLACDKLLKILRARTLAKDQAVEGFNIGMNSGVVAGQTIFHCHIHLIPRRNSDVKNPRGGVRHVIPGKGSY